MFSWLSSAFRSVASCLQKAAGGGTGGAGPAPAKQVAATPAQEASAPTLSPEPPYARLSCCDSPASGASQAAPSGAPADSPPCPRLAPGHAGALGGDATCVLSSPSPGAGRRGGKAAPPTPSRAALLAPGVQGGASGPATPSHALCTPHPATAATPVPFLTPISGAPAGVERGAGAGADHPARTQQQQQQQQQQQGEGGTAVLDLFPGGGAPLVTPSPAVPAPGPLGRFMVDGGQVVGVANTVSRFNEARPVVAHVTPFADRVNRELAAEQQAAAAAAEQQAAAAAVAVGQQPEVAARG